MKILVLTNPNGTKVYLIIDKIVSYYEEGDETVVRMLDGSWNYVQETVEFITQQLIDAEVSSYTVYSSEERK